MSAPKWNTIKIEIPEKMISETKTGIVKLREATTKTNALSKSNGLPSVSIVTADIEKPVIVDYGQVENFAEYKANKKKPKKKSVVTAPVVEKPKRVRQLMIHSHSDNFEAPNKAVVHSVKYDKPANKYESKAETTYFEDPKRLNVLRSNKINVLKNDFTMFTRYIKRLPTPEEAKQLNGKALQSAINYLEEAEMHYTNAIHTYKKYKKEGLIDKSDLDKLREHFEVSHYVDIPYGNQKRRPGASFFGSLL